MQSLAWTNVHIVVILWTDNVPLDSLSHLAEACHPHILGTFDSLNVKEVELFEDDILISSCSFY